MELEFRIFCKNVNMYEDDPAAMLAYVDYVDQDQSLTAWWNEFQEDYV